MKNTLILCDYNTLYALVCFPIGMMTTIHTLTYLFSILKCATTQLRITFRLFVM